MPNLYDMKGRKMSAILDKVAEKMTPEIGEEIEQDPKILDVMLEAAREHLDKNPFEMTVEDQLVALRLANEEESAANPDWVRIPEEDFARLAAEAPAWPRGRHAYRSFRIRFGEGKEGIAKTFGAHYARIQRVFGEGYWHWQLDFPPFTKNKERQLYLGYPNSAHEPAIEWVLGDLDIKRTHDGAAAISRGRPLADEMLVIAWLFSDMIRVLVSTDLLRHIAKGYEIYTPFPGGEGKGVISHMYFDGDGSGVKVYNGLKIPGIGVDTGHRYPFLSA